MNHLLLLLLCLVLPGLVEAQAAAVKPNLIFVLLDNVGQEWFGCYGSAERCTPNIDRLATTGVRAEHCYTPPVCGPSRTVLLTGRYLLRSGFTLHHDAALYSGGGLDPAREVTFARPLRAAGYATGLAGKWQINNLYDEPDVLRRHGFDEQIVWPGSVDTNRVRGADYVKFLDAVRRESVEETVAVIQHIENRYWDPVFLRNGRREVHPGKFGPDVAQEFALDFIRRHRRGPFLLYYPMVLTHGQTFTQPVVPTPLNRNPNRPHQEMFADMLRYADKLVGDLVRALEDLKLRDNTILFVASDNGTEKEFTARRHGRPVRGGLYTLTEAGGDVVLIANSPKFIPGGRTLPLADFSDVLPTLCELAGAPLPAGATLDGRSFAGYLRAAPGAKPPRDWIFNQYHTNRVVRDTRFKLYSDGRLFDANADPDEQHDLAGSAAPDVVAARARLQRVLDSLPPDAPPPFLLRSQSGFKLRAGQRAAGQTKSGLRTEHFDRDPGWEGRHNRIVPATFPTVKQDFGYSLTHFAGKAAGELGGRIQRSTTPASYATRISKTLEDQLTASGSFAITASQAGAGVFFGWFNSQQPGGSGRPIGSVGLHLDFEREGGRLAVRLITSGNRSCGTFVTPYLPGKHRPTTLKNDGTPYHWTLSYDPQANHGDGRFQFTLRSDRHPATPIDANLPTAAQEEARRRFPHATTFSVDLPPGYRKEGAGFDRFGAMNMMKSGGAATLFFDDLQYDGKVEDFAENPGWVGAGNRVTFEDREPAGAHNFGFSADTSHAGGSPGEVGGGFWRTERDWGYYADRVGPLTLEQRLEARGKVKLVAAGPDSDMYFGWFSSAHLDAPPVLGKHFLGVHVGGPTRVGHYFEPQYTTGQGTRGKAGQGPLLKPGKAFEWSLVYDPGAANGHGELQATLGNESIVLPLKPGRKAEGARFDRFGLFSAGPGGQMVKIYFDDLSYSGGQTQPE